MVEYDEETGLPMYYSHVVLDANGDEIEDFSTEIEALKYLQNHQLDGEEWYVADEDRTAWVCRKRVGVFNLEEHGFDIATYDEDTPGIKDILKIYNKSYNVVIREVVTMHEDGYIIPWEHAKSFTFDDGFAMDILKVSCWIASHEIQCAFDNFMHEGTDTHHSCYWEDWEDCDWFEERVSMDFKIE